MDKQASQTPDIQAASRQKRMETKRPLLSAQLLQDVQRIPLPASTIVEPNRAIRVFPRRKKCDAASTQVTKRKRDNAPVELTVAIISTGFHLPQAKAARAMGISATAMKSVCRRLGISSWPYARRKKDHAGDGTSLPDGKIDAVLDTESPLSSAIFTPSHSHGFHANVPFKPIHQLEDSTHVPSGKPSPSFARKYWSASIPVSSAWAHDCTSRPIKHALSFQSESGSTTTGESQLNSPDLGCNREIPWAHRLQVREDNREDLGFLIH